MEDQSQNQQEELPLVPAEILFRQPSGPRVLLVLSVLLGLSLLFSALGVLVFQGIATFCSWDASVTSGTLLPAAAPAERWQVRLLLAISHLSTFVLAGWITVRLFYPPASASMRYLGAMQTPNTRQLFGGILLILVSVPMVLFLYQINKALPLPESFHLMEEQMNDSIKGLLQMDNVFELLANLTLIALLPALGEELVFRGIVQQQLLRRIASPWLALLLTAAIFSFIHFQFEGFLPRMLLGFLLGWLYWQTGNFWVPVAAHFVNNGAQVFGQYLYHGGVSSVDLEQDVEVPWFAAALSIALMFWVIRWIRTAKPER